MHDRPADAAGHRPATGRLATDGCTGAYAVRAFDTPLGAHTAFPQDINKIVQRIAAWDQRGRKALDRLQSPPVFRQVFDFGSVVFDTHRLLRSVNTKRIDDWLNSPSTNDETKAAFESWRRAFGERYDAIRALTADILLSRQLVRIRTESAARVRAQYPQISGRIRGEKLLLGRCRCDSWDP